MGQVAAPQRLLLSLCGFAGRLFQGRFRFWLLLRRLHGDRVAFLEDRIVRLTHAEPVEDMSWVVSQWAYLFLASAVTN